MTRLHQSILANIALLIIAIPSITYGDAPDAGNYLPGFQVTFDTRNRLLGAKVTLELRAADVPNEYIFTIEKRARGLAKAMSSGKGSESSRFALTGQGIRPLHYRGDESDILFDWDEGIAQSTYKGDTASIALQPQLFDRLSADIFVMQRLRSGTVPAAFDIVDRNKIRRYDLITLGEEEIEVPAGTFSTVKLMRRRQGSSRSTHVWYAVDEDYLPVRIEQIKNGESSVALIASELASIGAP
ncbi:MAG: DUF3108 domain-containing protein [Gammaproteobacteria bacterium]|jgi:hypothetical protein|nr:DUF3108 domain-containing protein [Gammaproteobacteria bacterium]MDP6617010.1 DUF3108 domain-containing protein [Gammaproteobacteria bacterium]MDP6695098.1 DUF3108 domain-containing protein [Gammaproteobacteria bacterium]MDP7042222.1 DUF3108 domain-containing protein [Gammaproteobacteria bacterium]